jgi:hypothetical protein
MPPRIKRFSDYDLLGWHHTDIVVNNTRNSENSQGFPEVVSKPQIRFKGKAQADRESAAYIWVCEHLSEAVLHLTL